MVGEVNFTANDQDLLDAILFALGTTNGKLVCTSKPFNTDSVFWKMCNHKDYSDFARYHVSWQRVVEPHGPWKQSFLEKIKRQFGEDPVRWRRDGGRVGGGRGFLAAAIADCQLHWYDQKLW